MLHSKSSLPKWRVFSQSLNNATLLDAALRAVLDSGPQATLRIAGTPAEEVPLRDALERAYRDLAAQSSGAGDRIRLVDAANQVRRWTMR